MDQETGEIFEPLSEVVASIDFDADRRGEIDQEIAEIRKQTT